MDWDDEPNSDPWTIWMTGVVFPAFGLLLGIYILWSDHVPRISHSGWLGSSRRGVSFALLADPTLAATLLLTASCFFHLHGFWGNSRWAGLVPLGKQICIVAGLGGLVVFLVQNFRF